MKKPLVLYGVLSRDPIALGTQNQGCRDQVPTFVWRPEPLAVSCRGISKGSGTPVEIEISAP